MRFYPSLLSFVSVTSCLFSAGFDRAYGLSSSPRRSETLLNAKWRRNYFDENDDGRMERQTDRPTETKTDLYDTPTSPAKPKIVVLGATGRIGRLVVQELMELDVDCTIVAVVQSFKAASEAFYVEGESLVPRNKKNGPQLQIVEGDLVPSDSLPGQVDEEYSEDESDFERRAASAASFYGNAVIDYDNRDEIKIPPLIQETLENSFRGCTAVINCVGAVRPTHVWTDLLKVPLWRILRKDVSGWCRDKRHPYYVHYAATRMVLGIAESEQRRRQAAAQVQADLDRKDIGDDTVAPDMISVPRIRLIRISDLCVAYNAWDFIPLVTNSLQSMVFRYQYLAERLMDQSSLVDTIQLRPGDLMDDDRDTDTTSLQVDPSGFVPSPARVGRQDVASVAVAAALFTSNEEMAAAKEKSTFQNSTIMEPFHYTLGIRWTGQDLHPYPPQGQKQDGLEDARQCMDRVLKIEKQKSKRQRRIQQLRQELPLPSRLLYGLGENHKKRSLKPYAICSAVLSYLVLGLVFITVSRAVLVLFPGGHHITTALSRSRDLVWSKLRATATTRPMISPRQVKFRSRSKSYISF